MLEIHRIYYINGGVSYRNTIRIYLDPSLEEMVKEIGTWSIDFTPSRYDQLFQAGNGYWDLKNFVGYLQDLYEEVQNGRFNMFDLDRINQISDWNYLPMFIQELSGILAEWKNMNDTKNMCCCITYSKRSKGGKRKMGNNSNVEEMDIEKEITASSKKMR